MAPHQCQVFSSFLLRSHFLSVSWLKMTTIIEYSEMLRLPNNLLYNTNLLYTFRYLWVFRTFSLYLHSSTSVSFSFFPTSNPTYSHKDKQSINLVINLSIFFLFTFHVISNNSKIPNSAKTYYGNLLLSPNVHRRQLLMDYVFNTNYVER